GLARAGRAGGHRDLRPGLAGRALAPRGGLDHRAVAAHAGDLDAAAGDRDAQEVEAALEPLDRVEIDRAGVRPARGQRRATAARYEVADAVVLGALVDVVVAGEHRGDLVLLEQRRPALAQIAVAAVQRDRERRVVHHREHVVDRGILARGDQLALEPRGL